MLVLKKLIQLQKPDYYENLKEITQLLNEHKGDIDKYCKEHSCLPWLNSDEWSLGPQEKFRTYSSYMQWMKSLIAASRRFDYLGFYKGHDQKSEIALADALISKKISRDKKISLFFTWLCKYIFDVTNPAEYDEWKIRSAVYMEEPVELEDKDATDAVLKEIYLFGWTMEAHHLYELHKSDFAPDFIKKEHNSDVHYLSRHIHLAVDRKRKEHIKEREALRTEVIQFISRKHTDGDPDGDPESSARDTTPRRKKRPVRQVSSDSD